MSAHKIVHHLETVFFELWRLIHNVSNLRHMGAF